MDNKPQPAAENKNKCFLKKWSWGKLARGVLLSGDLVEKPQSVLGFCGILETSELCKSCGQS